MGGTLVAYLVGDGASRRPSASCGASSQRDLPGYMLPSAMVWLDALPRTPNGKLDRRALPGPRLGQAGPRRGVRRAAHAAEAMLAEIWADVLEVERVGIHDSFFDLGGASFSSVAIAARANEAGLPLSADLLFAYPTIADLTELAAQMTAAGVDGPDGEENIVLRSMLVNAPDGGSGVTFSPIDR